MSIWQIHVVLLTNQTWVCDQVAAIRLDNILHIMSKVSMNGNTRVLRLMQQRWMDQNSFNSITWTSCMKTSHEITQLKIEIPQELWWTAARFTSETSQNHQIFTQLAPKKLEEIVLIVSVTFIRPARNRAMHKLLTIYSRSQLSLELLVSKLLWNRFISLHSSPIRWPDIWARKRSIQLSYRTAKWCLVAYKVTRCCLIRAVSQICCINFKETVLHLAIQTIRLRRFS